MWVKSFSLPSVFLFVCLFVSVGFCFLEFFFLLVCFSFKLWKELILEEKPKILFFKNQNCFNAFCSNIFPWLLEPIRRNTYVLVVKWGDLAVMSAIDYFLEFIKNCEQLFKQSGLFLSNCISVHICLTICGISNAFLISFWATITYIFSAALVFPYMSSSNKEMPLLCLPFLYTGPSTLLF